LVGVKFYPTNQNYVASQFLVLQKSYTNSIDIGSPLKEKLMQIKAVCFDLHGTLVYVAKPVSEKSVSDLLVSRGYEAYPQALGAAWQYVSFVDYPKYGYRSWSVQIQRVLRRLGIEADKETIKELTKLYENAKWTRFPDVEDAFEKAKKLGLKTAIVTTIARFKFKEALRPILSKVDVLVDGYTFHCEKSNPKIYLKTLEALNVDASEAVMVGDDMELDIRLPKRLGMKAILLDRSGQSFSQRPESEADSVVKNLNEAIDALTELL
jgi:putative hydrolase of the HAD superfamily